jgi:hypothetical protein
MPASAKKRRRFRLVFDCMLDATPATIRIDSSKFAAFLGWRACGAGCRSHCTLPPYEGRRRGDRRESPMPFA